MAIEKSLNRLPPGLTKPPRTGLRAIQGGLASPKGAQPNPDDEPLDIQVIPDDPEDDEPESLFGGDPDDAPSDVDRALADAEAQAKEEADDLLDLKFSENLAEELIDEDRLSTLASELIDEFDEDLASRKEWVQTYVDGLELLGMKIEERTEPWEGACGVYHPLLSEALVKFQAETMMETFPATGPVKTQVVGKETSEKLEAGRRVTEDMNYQMTEKMVEYRPEHERLLWGLGLAGNAFKKIYFDPSLKRQTAVFVPAEDLVVPYGATSLQTSERVTHVMRKTPNEVKKLQASGFYRDIDLAEPTDTFDEVEKKIAERMGFRASSDDRYKLLEMHVDLLVPEDDMLDEEDGIARPYVVTIERGENKILAVRRNWKPDDDLMQKRNHFVHYQYVPGFGFYAFGLIHLIGAFAKSGTSIIRQLVDAGTLSNLPGGFKTKGMRVKGDDTPIGPGEWRDVDVASGTMRDNIMPLPYKEPSQVLAALLQTIVDEGRRFASAADLKVSDMSSESPVGTTLAILERTMKVISAVQARIYYSMRQEFRLIRDIIRDFTPDEYNYDPDTESRKAKKEDYELVEVIPVSDPNASTMAQKVVQYQAVIQLAQMAPQIYDLPFLHRQMLEVLGISNADKLVPVTDDQKPRDPVSENMSFLNGKPTKAFIHQDHEAHIAVHMGLMNDPTVQATMGQNPQAPMIMGAIQSHILEHVAFQYRKQIEEEAGVPYPEPDALMDPTTETAISRLAAAAAQKVLAANQAKAAQAEAQQAAQDPVVQMAQKELELKEKEFGLKEKKTMADIASQADKLEIEKERIEAQKEIAGMQVGSKIATSKAELDSKQEEAGLRMGIEVSREASQREHEGGKQGRDHAHASHEGDKKAALALLQASQQAQAKQEQEEAAAGSEAEAEAPEPEEGEEAPGEAPA